MFVTLLLPWSLLHNGFYLLHEKPQSFRHLQSLLLLFQSYYEIRQYVGHTLNIKCGAFYSKSIFSDLFLGAWENVTIQKQSLCYILSSSSGSEFATVCLAFFQQHCCTMLFCTALVPENHIVRGVIFHFIISLKFFAEEWRGNSSLSWSFLSGTLLGLNHTFSWRYLFKKLFGFFSDYQFRCVFSMKFCH